MRSWLNCRTIVPPDGLAEAYRHENVDANSWLYPKQVLAHWVDDHRTIDIPEQIRDAYRRVGRPTPLTRARGLERALGVAWRIFLKREDLLPNGSFKICSAIPQAFYGAAEGRREVVTETGAGQTGAAAALACQLFGLAATVFMVRSSFDAKPLRRRLMEFYGATVHPSPSDVTAFGRHQLATGNSSGSIAIATSEVFEVLRGGGGMNIAGSLLDFTLTYNSLLGLETIVQLGVEGIRSEVVVGCVGGGSSFGGFAIPFVEQDDDVEVIAVESDAIPTLTRGEYRFDHPDGGGQAPPMRMYTLGYDFRPPAMHASGLRYHAASPIVSYLVRAGRVRAVAHAEADALAAGRLLARTEGIVVAPEASYVVREVVERVQREPRRSGTIVGVLTGAGALDLDAYGEDPSA
jgi:pyridoxal-phosphate dependent TrpB-like enzyme